MGRSKQGNTFSLCNELLSELVNFIFISFDTRELISNLYVASKIFASKNLKRSECVLYSLCLSLVSPDLVSGRTDLLYVDTFVGHGTGKTGKTGNLVLLFHLVLTQGKIC